MRTNVLVGAQGGHQAGAALPLAPHHTDLTNGPLLTSATGSRAAAQLHQTGHSPRKQNQQADEGLTRGQTGFSRHLRQRLLTRSLRTFTSDCTQVAHRHWLQP